jgi:glycosyltransferase involved in cell wall biosynthesis
MTRLVQLTTYPLRSPRHGGQLRCAAIRERYRSIGIEVETIAVLHEGHYRAADREANDIALPADSAYWTSGLTNFTDLQIGRFLAADEHVRQRFFALLRRLRPDVIQLEQPWLFPAVARYLDEQKDEGSRSPLLVYSSQNIEWKLKRDDVSTRASAAADYARELANVQALERDVVSRADLVVACTDQELGDLRAMADVADSPRRYVVAPNAIAPFAPDPKRTQALARRFGLDRYPIFVGSAHPPNADGFWRMLAPSLAFLRPDEKIVVAGGVGHLLRDHAIYRAWSGINEPRLLVLGEIERNDLIALLYGAAAILLPITTGGGSNLKTAEAIYSGNPVVATTHALRGYGDAAQWPTVVVADAPERFRRALREMLDRNAASPPDAYSGIRSAVTWERALAPLTTALEIFLKPDMH